jgi:hypothetical protein
MFYLGSTSVTKIQTGYHGSVSSRKYKSIWKSELTNNPDQFKTVILTTHQTRKEAVEREYYLQVHVKASVNDMYINEAYARRGFAYGKSQTKEHIRKRTAHRKGVPAPYAPNRPPMTKEHRAKFSMTGRTHSPESNEANRIKHLGKQDTAETRKKRSESAIGRPKLFNSVPFLCRISDHKELAKNQASRWLPELKCYF